MWTKEKAEFEKSVQKCKEDDQEDDEVTQTLRFFAKKNKINYQN